MPPPSKFEVVLTVSALFVRNWALKSCVSPRVTTAHQIVHDVTVTGGQHATIVEIDQVEVEAIAGGRREERSGCRGGSGMRNQRVDEVARRGGVCPRRLALEVRERDAHAGANVYRPAESDPKRRRVVRSDQSDRATCTGFTGGKGPLTTAA